MSGYVNSLVFLRSEINDMSNAVLAIPARVVRLIVELHKVCLMPLGSVEVDGYVCDAAFKGIDIHVDDTIVHVG